MEHLNVKNISILILFALAVACKNEKPETVEEETHHEHEGTDVTLTRAQIRTAGVTVGKIEEKQISGTIKVNGILDVPPQQLVSISAPLGGFLKSTSLLEGSRVKKGEAIATIENLDFIQIQQDYLEARSNFEFTKADYDRQQALAKESVNSEKILQQAKANFTSSQAKYVGLKEKLKLLNLNPSTVEEGILKGAITLYSPIDGYVTEVNVNIGKFVNPADVLFEIVDTEHLHAELIVFERDVPKIQLKQKVRFTLANETKERMATVYLIGREINQDRTIQIHCHIDQEDKELLPGMFLNAVVETGSTKTAALPEEAIVDYQGKKFIFVQEEENEAEGAHYRMEEVEVGSVELGYAEIRTEELLKLMEANIVIKGAYALLSKMKNAEEEGGHHH